MMENVSPEFPTISQLMEDCDHFSDVRFGKNEDELFLLSSHDGAGTLRRIQIGSDKAEEISNSHNVRGTVGYGGGSFDCRENAVSFCEKDGSIWFFEPRTHHPFIQVVSGSLRTSSCKISPNKKTILYIFEKAETNGIGIADIQMPDDSAQLATGADFYMQPTWHPQGNLIAWVEWDHPHMPWDASRIKLGQLDNAQSRLIDEKYIDGAEAQSANQPLFSPDGNYLSFIQRNGEWDDLVLYNLNTKEKTTVVQGDGFHLRMPDWIQGLHSYQWTPDSQTILFIKYHFGTASLEQVNIHTHKRKIIQSDPYIWLSQLDISGNGKTGALIGQTTSNCDQVVLIDLVKGNIQKPELRKKEMACPSPQMVTFLNREGIKGYAWFYPARENGKGNGQPPCLIKIHSGPTSLKHAGYSPETEFFQLHGFSVAHINYRGSVSFGYSYQYALERKWGDAEIEDTLDMIDILVKIGLITKDRLAVMGSSAGGFSVLQLLIKHPGLFKAAICSYAVSDLVDDAKNTHKFEKYYHRFLTGNFPEEEARFIARSPITHLEYIKDPVAIFHGKDDPVVSVQQSEKIYRVLRKNNIPSSLMVFEEEGHGFRQSKNIDSYYQAIIQFLNSYL